MKQSQNNNFTSMLNKVDAELKQLKKERDLLLKRHYFVFVQREVQTLQHQDAENIFVHDLEKEENNNSVFISKQTFFVVSNKQSAEKNLSIMIIK